IVPHASKLRIGKSNFRRKSDISSKESTLQLAYDVLRLTPFYKAFLVTADVEHKDVKKSNEMYYPRFTKVIVHYFMSKDPLIPRRNRVNWHYVRDDQMFTTIKLVSRHQDTQQFSAMLPIKLTNADIRNSKAYKEYYAVARGATPRKTKASTRLSTSTKGKEPAKASKTKSLTILSEVAMTKAEQLKLAIKRSMQQTYISQASEESNDDDQDSEKEGEEFIHPKLTIHDEEETKDEEIFDPISKTPEHTDDEGNDEENLGLNVGMEERQDEEDDKDELYRDANINLEGRVVQIAYVHTTQEFEDSHVTLTPVNPNGQQQNYEQQLEAEVLTRLSNSSKTSYAVIADLSEMVLKKILIEKMEGNKSIHRSNKQRNLYKALVKAYEYDKIILDTYEDTVTLKRRRDDDADKDEEPSAGSDRGPRDEEKEGSQSQQALQRRKLPRPRARLHKGLNLDKRLQARVMKKCGGARILSKRSLEGRCVIPFDHFINNDLEYLRGGDSSHKYTTFVTKTKAADYGHIKWIEDLVPRTMWIQEPVGYDKHALWGISHWGRKRQQFYEFTVNKEDDDKLHKFKEGDFKRLCIQDIEDMLLLLVQGKLTNLMVEERFAFNVSLRMFTRSIVIQRYVEDLQLDNKDKQNRLMRIDELHKFSDGTLTDVRTTLDGRLKGIRMKYLP
nr:hypothetical protein [Tanacetum cinerariifolium]